MYSFYHFFYKSGSKDL